jgi:hypothetical protein
LSADEADLRLAEMVWTKIGVEFNNNRERLNAGQAWKIYQKRLNEHCGVLSRLFSAKDIVEISMKIEANIKSDSGTGEQSGLEYARSFLNGPARVKAAVH